MGVPLHTGADDRAIQRVQCGEQGGRAVAFVVVRQRLGAPLLQGQARLRAVQRLDLGFLVQRQNQGMRWGVQIEPHHVLELLGKAWIRAEFEAPQAVGLEAMPPPDAANRGFTDIHHPRHAAGTPVGRIRRRLLRGLSHNRLHRLRRNGGRAPGAGRIVLNARQTALRKP
jgi:hypothetical protein